MIVVGLDLSLTNAGIAVLTDGRPTLLTSVGHGGRDGASWDQRRRRIVSQSRAVMQAVDLAGIQARRHPLGQVDLAVIEGPAYASKFGDPFDRAALWWGVYSALAAKQVPIAVVTPTTLKKFATGKGNAKKPDVHAAVKAEWADPGIRNHDIADALALAAMGALHLGDPLSIPTPPWRINGLDAVTWPEQVNA